jgi:hypothetical protein
MATENIDIVVSLKDRAGKGLETLQSKMQKMGTAAIGAGVAATAVGAAITGFSVVAVKEAAEAEGAMAKFNTVFAGGAGEMLEFVDELRKEMPTARQEIIKMAGGLQDLLVPLGLSRESAQGMTQEILDLSNKIAAFNDVDPTEVLEAFRSGLTGSSEPLKRFGINASVAALETRALEEGLLETGQTFNDLDAATRSQVQAQALLAQSIANSSDAINGFEENNDSFLRRWQDLQATMQEFMVVVGAPLLEVLDSILQAIMPIVDTVGQWIQQHPQLTAAITLAVAAIGAFLAIAGPLLVVFGSLAVAAGALNISMLPIALTIGGVILAIGLLVAAGYLLMKNWDTVKQFFIDSWEKIKTAFVKTIDAVRSYIETNFGFLIEWFNFWWSSMNAIFTLAMAALQFAWNFFWEAIKSTATLQLNVLKGVVNFAFTAIKTAFDKHIAALKSAWNAVWSTFGPVVTAVFSGIKSGVVAMVNFVISKINALIRGIRKISGALNKIPGVNITAPPEIPMLANGGIVTKPTLAMIGEGGESEAVVPLSKAGQMGFGGGGANITVVINDSVVTSEEDIVEKIGDPLIRVLKEHMAVA